jgi:hypothetical protein
MASNPGHGGQRPKQADTAVAKIGVYRHEYVLAVCRAARRAWEAEKAKGGRLYRVKKPDRSLRAAVDYLVRLRMAAIGKALADDQPGAAILGLAGLEDRCLGRVSTADPMVATSEAKPLVLVLGPNQGVNMGQFGYRPAARALPAHEPEGGDDAGS